MWNAQSQNFKWIRKVVTLRQVVGEKSVRHMMITAKMSNKTFRRNVIGNC